jgi:hypothetical protein
MLTETEFQYHSNNDVFLTTQIPTKRPSHIYQSGSSVTVGKERDIKFTYFRQCHLSTVFKAIKNEAILFICASSMIYDIVMSFYYLLPLFNLYALSSPHFVL